MTRSESTTKNDTRSTTQDRVRRSRSSDCRCGQQLDVCARAHCPRCGRSIQPA